MWCRRAREAGRERKRETETNSKTAVVKIQDCKPNDFMATCEKKNNQNYLN